MTFSTLWSISFFFVLTYLTLVISTITYLLPVASTQQNNSSVSTSRTDFSFVNSSELLPLFVTPYILILLLNLACTVPTLSVWFGHVVVTGFQMKLIYLLVFVFVLYIIVLTSTTYVSSREIYDYINTTFSIFYWVLLLFTANSLLTVIFVIEVLSATLFLLIITSTFSSNYFYRNLNLSFGHLFQQSTPFTYLQSILFFFWISLVSSLNLFLYCLLLYSKIYTLDWSLLEYIFHYFINITSTKDIYTVGFAWYTFIFCIFLKCGLAPFYVWKPSFFKGLPLYTLFFYISFFYFFLFLFLIHLLTVCLGEIFYYYIIVVVGLVVVGLSVLLFILCESFYLKSFLAMSSILNSLFVFLAMTSSHVSDALLWV